MRNRALALLGLIILPFCALIDLVEAIIAAHVDTFIELHEYCRRLVIVLRTGEKYDVGKDPTG